MQGHGRTTFKDVRRQNHTDKDGITLTKTDDGWQMEGLRKDVMRLASGLEHRLAPQDTE